LYHAHYLSQSEFKQDTNCSLSNIQNALEQRKPLHWTCAKPWKNNGQTIWNYLHFRSHENRAPIIITENFPIDPCVHICE
jgi:hypothetical protein